MSVLPDFSAFRAASQYERKDAGIVLVKHIWWNVLRRSGVVKAGNLRFASHHVLEVVILGWNYTLLKKCDYRNNTL